MQGPVGTEGMLALISGTLRARGQGDIPPSSAPRDAAKATALYGPVRVRGGMLPLLSLALA